MKPRRLQLLGLAAAALAALGMARPPAASPAASPSPTPTASAAPPATAAPLPTPLAIGEDSRPFKDAPDAIGIAVEGGESSDDDDNSVTANTEFSIQFPDAMVAPNRIDATDSESPITLWPDLNARWVWRTQSQGVWAVHGPLIPGQAYRMRLRDGLKTLAGDPLDIAKWGYEIQTAVLTVTSDSSVHDSLSAQPQVPLEFNFPIRLQDAAAGCWFQDRLTRQRFPAEVLLNHAVSDVTGDVVDVTNAAAEPPPTEFRVRPRDPLPVGHYYDLIVDGMHDAYAGRTLPYPEVFALGRTQPLAVDYVAARNWATDKPHIEVKFHGNLGDDPLPADALTIEPTVPNLRFRKEGELLLADGDFDVAKRYRVVINPAITGELGYPMAKAETWGATFHPKPATLLFPTGTIRQRAALGLRFALLQANTGPVTWRLARIPLERLGEVQTAMNEPTAPLIDALHLPVVGTGELPASMDDRDVVRPIEWKPAAGAPALSGPYVMEASARDNAGATIANLALIFFDEAVFTQKTMPAGTALRLAKMSDSTPLANVTVKVLTPALTEITHGTTDQFGVVFFPAASLAGAAFFAADTPGTPSVEPASPGSSFPDTGSYYSSPPPVYLGTIITDRPLYRPGEEVRFKGFLRHNADDQLTPPAGSTATWQVINSDRDERVAEGTAKVDAFGGWDAAWTVPPKGKLGDFRITAKIGETDAGSNGTFRVDEFRNPPFSVVCESPTETQPAVSTISVASQYFHGAPNVGSTVKWTATWLSDSDGEYYNDEDANGFKRVDLYSEQRRTPAFEAEISGETQLDGKGRATLTCPAPFKDPGLRAACNVSWRVDVTGPDGQTITGGAEEKVVMNDVTLGVKSDSATGVKDIAFDLQALARATGDPAPGDVQACLYLVQTKSVKERLAPFVYRYRNTDEFVPVEQRKVPGNGRLAFTPKTPGRYVLVVTPLPGQPGIAVSDEIYLAGEGDAELPVKNDQALVVKPATKDAVPVGGTAAFDVLAPSGGIAWVTVETDHVLDTFTMPIPGNATRIEIPVKVTYAPNVHVSAYLLRPGRTDDLPGEMYGSTELKVSEPDAALALAIATDRPEYEPRNRGTITVRATAGGKPVTGASITLYAVDDSILTLGGWTLPDLLGTFLPDHPFAVVTRLALSGYVESFSDEALTQKGFVVGGGGKDDYGNTQFVRQNFRPRILWLPALTTGPGGVATAKFETPDNLTRFRVVALGQTRTNQFGSGNTTFTVSKPLIVEPALPRFLRQGDSVELRAVARQKASPEEKLTIRCAVGEGVTLDGPDSVALTATKNDPAVATFRARIADDATAATIRFAVTSDTSASDEVEVTLPVATRTIEVRESVAGTTNGPTFDPAKKAPAAWLTTPGDCDVTLSTSPYLPKLLGIPTVLDYPFGCFEQKSSRLLVYTALAKLLAFLPQPAERDANYRKVIEETLQEFDKSLLPDDTLPYWPYGTNGNPFVTIQSAWAVAQAQQAGYTVPEDLANALPRALNQMVLRKSRLEVPPSLRAFALFVLSQLSADAPDDDVAAAANELFLGRNRLTDEARGFLAVALHTWNLEPDHQQELIREIPEKFDERAFDPTTFSSTTRAEAICTWARLLITPDAAPRALKADLEAQMSNSTSLSTQENLWLLIAFNALVQQKPPTKITASLAPPPDATSPNQSAAAWIARDLAHLRDLSIHGASKATSYVLAARRSLAPAEQTAVGKGMRLERIVKNLTDPARTGTAEAPFKLGDQVLISFRFHCDTAQSYVAIEAALPAGLEVLNPNLEMIGKFYQIPDEPGAPAAWLSFSEMRDQQTNLFFDTLTAGAQSYAILARATSVGTFAWPSTQMTPMYDARAYARTAPTQCVVKE
jgi:uncharacterized protein YfaS (alpha-2-macroglobulin family)